MKNIFYSTLLLFITLPASEFILHYTSTENVNDYAGNGVTATTVKSENPKNAYCLDATGVAFTNGPCTNVTVTATTPVICAGSNDTLMASGATTYTWSPSTALNTTTGAKVIANPTATTIYTVTGTYGGCITTAADTVTVNPLPIVGGFIGGSPCPGGTILVLSGGSASFNTWTILGDSVPVYTIPNQHGDTTETIGTSVNPITTTTYVVKGAITYLDTTVSGNIDTNVCSNSKLVIDTVYPTIINVSTPMPICLGDSTSLSVSGAVSYTWNPSAGLSSTADSAVFANPTTTTTYTVTGTNAYGCVNSDTLIVNVVVDKLPTVSIASTAIGLCPGNNDTLIASGATIYSWNPVLTLSSSIGDTVIANPTTTTTYIVTGTYGIGCAIDTIMDTVTVYPPVIKPTYTRDGDTLISSSKYNNQWYRNDTLLNNDTSQNLIINISGEYQVNVSNVPYGCSTSSDSMKITLAGIEQLEGKSDKLSIFPNPSSGQFTIKLQDNQNVYSIEIYNLVGEKIYQSVLSNSQNAVNFSSQPAGMYFVYLKSEEGVEMGKVLIAK
jgi:hypothetical protein